MKEFIPIVLNPYPDELLFSWLTRLANANCMSFLDFYKKFFNNNTISNTISIESKGNFLNFYNSLACNMPADELYLQLSTLSVESIAYTKSRQIKLIQDIFQPTKNTSKITSLFIHHIRFCEDCAKEDIEKYGEFYIHRSHQISGVCVCYKHKTSLVQSKVKTKFDLKTIKERAERIDFDESIEDAYIYANYVQKLLFANIQSNTNDISKIIIDCLEMANRNRIENKKKIADILKSENVDGLYSDLIWENGTIPVNKLIKIIQHIYPNPQDFLNALLPYKLIIQKHCDKCDKDYYTTEKAIEYGWGCNYCDNDMNNFEFVKRVINNVGKNRYMIKNIDEKYKLQLQHTDCKQDLSLSFDNFVFYGKRCHCERTYSQRKAEKAIKEFGNFKLIEFNGRGGFAKIHHEDCNSSFSINSFDDFLDRPKCRCCEMKSWTPVTQEMFEQEVRDIVGDEYTVVGDVNIRNDRVLIRHNVCGHVHNHYVLWFLEGTRCPKCAQKTTDHKLKVMLEQYAGDRYEIIGHQHHKVILQDHEENKEIRIRAKHIVQEILRPTPSRILPTNKTIQIEENMTSWDAWYQLCIDYKNEFGHLCLQKNEKYKGFGLEQWCGNIRKAYNKGRLSDEQIEKLKAIDFIFDKKLHMWKEHFNAYKAYVKLTGDNYPSEKAMYKENKVGKWFVSQRRRNACGKLNPVYKELLLEFDSDFFKDLSEQRNRNSQLIP